MTQGHAAIVLKQLPSIHRVAILDRRVGRLDAVVRKQAHVGSMIEYAVERRSDTMVFVSHHQIIDMPFELAREDVLFWHHVLELCYYFVPLGSYTPKLFELCAFLYTVDTDVCWRVQSKKLYLFKLLTTIGLYPRIQRFSLEKMHYFMALNVSQIMQEQIDEQQEKILDEWLRVCIGEHPAIAKFNTIHYLIAK